MASAIFAPTWRSVRPGLSHPGTLACTRSIASPAALSAPDLGRRLAHPQRGKDGARETLLRRREDVLEREHVQRPHPVGQGDRARVADGARDHPERVLGFSPGQDFQAEGAGRRGLRRLELKPGHQQERVPLRGDRQAGQPLKLLGVIAGHVAQVGARGKQQDVQATGPDRFGDPGEALARVQGGIGAHVSPYAHGLR